MSARRSVSLALVWLCAAAGALVWCSAPALGQREHEFSFSFGAEGSGDGQFSQPGAMAVSEVGEMKGDVYVIDRGNGRVEIFSSAGGYVGQFNASASPLGAFSFAANPEGEIAVDNSTNPLDPSAGDVYVVSADKDENIANEVVDKFSASGTYIDQLIVPREAEVVGVAVDSSGRVWVDPYRPNYDVFNDALVNELISSEISTGNYPPGKHEHIVSGDPGTIGMAIDSEGNLYAGDEPEGQFGAGFDIPAKFTSEGVLINDEFDTEDTTAFAMDRSSNDVYVDNITGIAVFGPTGFPIERFGSAQLSDSEGVAVDSSTGTVYASDDATQSVNVFTSFVVPDVSTDSASNFDETSVTVSGVVNPDGLPVSSCVFEYGTTTAYGQERECSATPGSGDAPVAVSANLTGLERLTSYHYRLRAANSNGSNFGVDGSFLTPEPVVVSEEGVSDVSSTSALFSALVNPEGSDTTFHFEYGPGVSYGESVPVPDGDLGGSTSGVPVSARPEDLRPDVTYHVRLVVSNTLGVAYGPDEAFTTQEVGGAFALPDGREWEMVSPPKKYGAALEPFGDEYLEEGLVQASEDGSAIAYGAGGPLSAGPPANTASRIPVQVLSRRDGGGSGPGGWSTEEIGLPHSGPLSGEGYSLPEYRAFSGDLSTALVQPSGEESVPLLSPEATEPTPYLRNDGTGGFLALVSAGDVPPGTKFSGKQVEIDDVLPVTATPDLSHVLLKSEEALTANAKPTETYKYENIYEWAGGRLKLINVLPNGEWTPGGWVGHGVGNEAGSQDIRGAISNDGSKVFWQTGRQNEEEWLYMRDTVTERTEQVGYGRYQIATADGSRMFFTSAGNLYVSDTLTGTKTDLTGEAGGVVGEVLGIGEAGSVVYFVATGKLAEGAEPGEPNLYMASETGSEWSTQLVAVLSTEDEPDWVYGGTVRVTPSGQFLAFMSNRSLTGYDNHDIGSGVADEEVFLYDDATGRLVCASCNPTEERPAGAFSAGLSASPAEDLLSEHNELWHGRWIAADIPAWPRVGQEEGSEELKPHQPRYLSDEGRLFFNGFDPLVPQATNGRANVYEYEPGGVGSCASAKGCVSLITSGTSGEESMFMDASESGDDVFFLTASKLLPQDVENNLSMYDAHVCSAGAPCVSSPVLPPPCSSGDACKPAPSLQPTIFGAPASATFAGKGNLLTSPPKPVVTTPKSLTRSQKLARALRACVAKRSRRGRAVCERRARKRYGARQARKATATRRGDR